MTVGDCAVYLLLLIKKILLANRAQLFTKNLLCFDIINLNNFNFINMMYYQPGLGSGVSSLFSIFFCLFIIGIFVFGFIFLIMLLARSGRRGMEDMSDEEKTAHNVNDAFMYSSEALYNKMNEEEKLSPKQIIQFARADITKRLDEIEKPAEAKNTSKEETKD